MSSVSRPDVEDIGAGHHPDPAQSMSLRAEAYLDPKWAPDAAELTHAKRLTYEIRADWKNLVDNFLECYHCHIAHREFVGLVDMGTYQVRTHGIWSSHFAEAGRTGNAAYDVSGASVTQHAVWWLWPNITIVESVQRGMATPAFDQGRIVHDPDEPGLSEHGVHHIHGLLLRAYDAFVTASR